MEGLEAGGTAPAKAANANVTLAPAVSKQKEIGLRDSYFKGLSISASYFDITRGNAVTDPVSNIFAYSGDLSYRGVESTLLYDFLRDWRLNAAVLRLWARQDSPAQPLIDGHTPENTPKWNGNAGLAYRVAQVPGLSVRGGIKVISLRPVNPQNTGYIPGYVLYDAGLGYATQVYGRRTFFQLVADNLSNRRYWNSVQTGTYGIGMDRKVSFNVKVDL
jgi:iron complex outermembrane receptor protein